MTVKIFVDGTFFSCPLIFKQLILVRCQIEAKSFIVTAAFMLAEKDDKKIFTSLNDLTIEKTVKKLAANTVHCDFEWAFIKTLKFFYDVPVKGCDFHFSNALKTNIKKRPKSKN